MKKMSLELIIEPIAGFAAGFRIGIQADRDMEYLVELSDYVKNSKLKNMSATQLEEQSKKSKEIEKKYIGTMRAIPALLAAVINLHLRNNLYSPLIGGGLTFLTTATGIKTGKYFSKKHRQKQQLSEEESKTIDNYLNTLKQETINENLSEAGTAFSEFLKYRMKICSEKRNVEILVQTEKKLEELSLYTLQYMQIKKFLAIPDQGYAVMKTGGELHDEAVALMIEKDKLYAINMSMNSYQEFIDEEKNCGTQIVNPNISREEKQWDGTTDSLMKIAATYSDKMVFIAKGNNDIPVKCKVHSILNAYTDMYEQKHAAKKEE